VAVPILPRKGPGIQTELNTTEITAAPRSQNEERKAEAAGFEKDVCKIQ